MKNRSLGFGISLGFLLLHILSGSVPTGADDFSQIAIKAQHILTISDPEAFPGIIMINNGKIAKIISDPDFTVPPDTEIIDAGEGWVMPGLIEACTTLGTGSRYEAAGADETSNPNTAQILMIDGINPFDKQFKFARLAGITTIMACPGGANVIGGQPAVLKCVGNTVENMALRTSAGVKFSLGEGPKNAYGKKGRLPSTRMGSAYVIRKALWGAREYLAGRKKYTAKKSEDADAAPPKKDLQLEPLADLLEKKIPAFMECYRADDIMTALRLVDEFKFNAVLIGCAEGYRVAEEIAKRQVPVVVSPFGVGPRRMETQALKIENAALLSRAGVRVALHAEESLGLGHMRELLMQAALAVKGGLDRDTALRAVTLTPAEILGVSQRIGSLEPQKDADLLILDGDPLHYKTRVLRVIINGKIIHSEQRKPIS